MFVYNTYSYINDVPTLINSSGFGKKDAYCYEYDIYDRLIKVFYSLDSSTLFEYTYDDNDNIKTIKNCEINAIYTFEYDEENNLISYLYDDLVINNIFDNSNQLCAKKVEIDDKKLVLTTHSLYKSLNNDFDNYKMAIRNDSDIMLCMFDEFAVTYKDESNAKEYVKHEQKIKLLNTKNKIAVSCDSNAKESYCSKDGFMTLYNLDSSNEFTFNVDGKVNTKNSVAFSFKATSSGVILLMKDDTTAFLKVELSDTKRIVVFDNEQIVFTSLNIYPLNTW